MGAKDLLGEKHIKCLEASTHTIYQTQNRTMASMNRFILFLPWNLECTFGNLNANITTPKTVPETRETVWLIIQNFEQHFELLGNYAVGRLGIIGGCVMYPNRSACTTKRGRKVQCQKLLFSPHSDLLKWSRSAKSTCSSWTQICLCQAHSSFAFSFNSLKKTPLSLISKSSKQPHWAANKHKSIIDWRPDLLKIY